MTKPAEKILSEALTLDTRERAEIAAQLIASLDGEPDEDAEAAWAAEVDRRMREVAAGRRYDRKLWIVEPVTTAAYPPV